MNKILAFHKKAYVLRLCFIHHFRKPGSSDSSKHIDTAAYDGTEGLRVCRY